MGNIVNRSTVYCTVKNESKQEILAMLQYNIDSKCINSDNDTLLHAVLRNVNLKEIDVIELLTLFLNRGDDPNVKNVHEETVLHLAIAKRMKKTVEVLLKFNADIRTVDSCGDTLAHFFIKDEYEKLRMMKQDSLRYTEDQYEKIEKEGRSYLEFLISKNFNFDWKNDQGNSALHLAISYKLQHLLPTLFKHTEYLRFLDKDDKKLLELFFKKSALARKSPLSNENPYQNLYRLSCVARSVKILMGVGIDVAFFDEYGVSLIRKAIGEKEHMIIIKILINHYLNDCHDNNFASTIFCELMSTYAYWSITENDYFFAVLTDLIVKGADVNKENRLRKRPVHIALEERNFKMLTFLKENGADFSVRSRDGNTLLHLLAEQIASKESNCDLHDKAEYLISCGGYDVNVTCKRGRSPLHTAAAHGNSLMVRKLIDLGADVNFKDKDLRTPLHHAAMMGKSVELVKLLLTNGADVNALDSRDETPLHLAVSNANLAIVRQLLGHGARVNCKNRYHLQTPLHLAAMKNETQKIIKLLLKYGADVNSKDRMGDTPPHYILKQYQLTPNGESLLNALLKNGPYANTTNETGKSILFCALSFGLIGMLREIWKHCAELNEPCLRCLIPIFRVNCSKQSTDLSLLQHKIKLTAAGFRCSSEYEAYNNGSSPSQLNHARLYDECLEEIDKLKNKFVTNNGTSLYTFLRMHPNCGAAYVKYEKLQQIVESPSFSQDFPNYSAMILDNYRQAIVRKSLLKRAKEAWNKLTKSKLPDSIDRVLVYLNIVDLVYIIKASDERAHGDLDDPMNVTTKISGNDTKDDF